MDVLGTSQIADAKIVGDLILTYEDLEESDLRAGRIASAMEVGFLGDRSRVLRDALDALEKPGRYYCHLSGPRTDTEDLNWYGVMMPNHVRSTMSPTVYPKAEFSVTFVCGLALLQDEKTTSDYNKTVAEVYRQIGNVNPALASAFIAQKLYAQNSVFSTDPANLRFRYEEEIAAGSVLEQMDKNASLFHQTYFQPTSEARWYVMPVQDIGESRTGYELDLSTGETSPSSITTREVDVQASDWGVSDNYGVTRKAGVVSLEGPGLSSLPEKQDFRVQFPSTLFRWEHISGNEGVALNGGELFEIAGTGVYRQRVLRVPALQKVGFALELSQVTWPADEGDTGLGYAGFAFYGEDGKTYIYNQYTELWQEGDPFTNDGTFTPPGSIFDRPIGTQDTRVTSAMPNQSGELYVFIYGYGETGDFSPRAQFKSVKVKLIDTRTNEVVDSMETSLGTAGGEKITLPLVTDMESFHPSFQWRKVGNWASTVTNTSHFTLAQAVASDRIALHPRLKEPFLALKGLYSPEFKLNIKSDSSPFDSDIPARIVQADINFRTGITTCEAVEIR